MARILTGVATLFRVFGVSNAVRVEFSGTELPARDRTAADLTVFDITKWFGETSGGVKTYLRENARFVASQPLLRQGLVIRPV